MAQKKLELTIASGGNLFTQPAISLENVPENGFSRILNFKRDKDQFVRRHGWVKFEPNGADPNPVSQYEFDSYEAPTVAMQLVRPNQDRAIVACGKTKIKRFDYGAQSWIEIGSGFSPNGNRWKAIPIDGYLVLNNGVDLPVTFRVEDSAVTPMYELRQVGIASALHMEEYFGFLFFANAREIIDTELGGIMNGADPFGPVDDSKVNHMPTLVLWNDGPGKPRSWAPIFTVTMNSASDTITLPFPPGDTFVEGVTRVAVVNGGPSNGTLGGQEDTPNGVLITDITGNVITLEKSTDGGISYPREVQVMRWTDVSTLSGKSDLQGDSSAIVALKKLDNQIVVYRSSGIYTGRYVGIVTSPFAFRERYGGVNVPIWPDCIATINGEYHLYPGVGGRFYMFEGVNEPLIHQKCDNARDLFFEGIGYDEECFAVDNPLTKEIWFCRSGKTFCYDYEYNCPSEMDFEVGCATLVNRPNMVDLWFILSGGKNFYTYALVEGNTKIVTWLRDGVTPSAKIVSGLFHGKNQATEKDIIELTPMLSSPSPNCAISVKLRGTHNPNAPLVELLDPPELLPNPMGDNYVVMLYRAIYFQYEISIIDTRDIGCRFSGIEYIIDTIRSGGVTRNKAN